MNRRDLKAIEANGCAAYRRGLSWVDNPYYRALYMPAITGDTVREWRAKLRAWERGWTREDRCAPERPGAALVEVKR